MEIVNPMFIGDIDSTSPSNMHPKLIERDGGPLTIWVKPSGEKQYALGVDVGEGLNADYSEIIVLQHDPLVVAAHYRNNKIKPGMLGVMAWLLGAYYLFGLLGIERNAAGLSTCEVAEGRGHSGYPGLTKYPNLYYHTRRDRKTLVETKEIGLRTGANNKESMLNGLAELFDSGGLDIYSWPLLYQMSGFKWMPIVESKGRRKKTGFFIQERKDPDTGLTHDDSIMALAIANEMRRFGNRAGYVGKIQVEDDW